MKTDPKNGEAQFRGTVRSLSLHDGSEVVSLGLLTFDGDQRAHDDMASSSATSTSSLATCLCRSTVSIFVLMPSMSVTANTKLDGDEVNAIATMNMVMQNLPQAGDVTFDMVFELLGADAESLGRVQRSVESAQTAKTRWRFMQRPKKTSRGCSRPASR